MKQKNLLFFFGFFVFNFFILPFSAQAQTSQWMWGGGVAPTNPPGYDGMGWISATNENIGGGSTYKVIIPPADGAVSGYGWSEYYGWIDFQPTGPYPAGPNHPAQREGNLLTGWARILSIQNEGINSGGWSGWIKLSGSGYGVDVTKFGVEGTYAWSDELGWIDFRYIGIPTDGKCGTAKRNYLCSETAYSPGDTFCDKGMSIPTTPSFPTSAIPVIWQCPGENGGKDLDCPATKQVTEDGRCGTNLKCAEGSLGEDDREFCLTGTVKNLDYSSGRWTWKCEGSCGTSEDCNDSKGLSQCARYMEVTP
ncbi:MAG: hypothetical protein IPN70_03835 [Candidatus Moraniibacteriota bacterium]|nr:MAG: hypothetical protein IPN70_03835 [Candidatus Moranbacteria bacterium]